MKKNNPLLMIGSYLGIVLTLLGITGFNYYVQNKYYHQEQNGIVNCLPTHCMPTTFLAELKGILFSGNIDGLIILIIVGFFLGWGLELLYRKL